MLINKQNIRALFRGYNVKMFKAVQEAKTFYKQISMTIPSTTESEQHAWLKQMFGMVEWLDEKSIRAVAAATYTLANRKWEQTISVDRDNIKDDKYGIYDPLISMMGEAAGTHPDYLMAETLSGGFTNLCYDGQYFFDTDHPLADGTTWSNKVTTAFSVAAYKAARISLATVKGDASRYVQAHGTLLVGSPALEDIFLRTIKRALVEESSAGGNSNIWFNTVDILLIPQLSTTTEWYLMDTSKVIKPLIFQEREAIHPVSVTDPGADSVFNTGKFKYGHEGRYATGYAFPQYAYGSTGTG